MQSNVELMFPWRKESFEKKIFVQIVTLSSLMHVLMLCDNLITPDYSRVHPGLSG